MREFRLSRVVNGGAIPKGTQPQDYLLDVYAWFASLLNLNIKTFCLKTLCNSHNSRIFQDSWRIIRQKIADNLLKKNA